MASLSPELLSGTLAADHPRIAALLAAIANRAAGGQQPARERALLADLLERSRARHAARLARLRKDPWANIGRFKQVLPKLA